VVGGTAVWPYESGGSGGVSIGSPSLDRASPGTTAEAENINRATRMEDLIEFTLSIPFATMMPSDKWPAREGLSL